LLGASQLECVLSIFWAILVAGAGQCLRLRLIAKEEDVA
jgi:hypothetical protein